MRINKDFKIREVIGETIIVNQGQPAADLTRIISLNKSARLLYERMEDRDFTLEDAAQVLEDAYGIDRQKAQGDAAAWVASLQKCGIIE